MRDARVVAEKQIIWKQEKGNINTRQWWLRALLISVLLVLQTWGCYGLVSNILGFQGETGSVRFYLCAVLATLVICFWNEWSRAYRGEKRKPVGSLVLLIGLIVVLWFVYGGVTGELSEGLVALGDTYIHRWNIRSREYRLSGASVAMVQSAAEFVVLVLMSLFQILGGLLRKSKIVLLIPITLVSAGLLVVALPQWSELAILLMSGLMLFCVDSYESISWKSFIILAVSSLLVICVTGRFQEDAEQQMLSMNDDWFNFWENKEEFIHNFELPQLSLDKSMIDNEPPEFDDKQIILLTMSEMPVGSVYLRGYHCKDYADGVWGKDTKAFQEACRKYGISEDEATEKLIMFQHEQEDIGNNQLIEYEFSYTGIKGEYCYFPYGVGWENTPENYELTQDYLIKKKMNDREGKVLGWQQLYHLNTYVAVSEELSLFQDWYNGFVYENYLTVADNQKAVKNLANEISRDSQFIIYERALNPEQSSYNEVNTARLKVAYLVAEWLKRRGTYSLDLDELPFGTDAIEYFLETSKEGFCEHFASAGTLILRELGVPARYVTGYVVKSGETKASGNKYVATVLDSDAHAWTEIYLENYGWVPIEMTPGYSSVANITSTPQATATPQVTATPQPEDMDAPQESMSPSEEENPTEAPEDVEPTPEKEELTPEEELTREESQDGESQEGELQEGEKDIAKGQENVGSKLWAVSALLGVMVLLSLVGYRYKVSTKDRGKKRLGGYMRRGENEKAVKWINATIYQQLVHKERKYSGISDGEFLQALKREFPEAEEARWDAYFEIVRRAAYSEVEISAEEVKECYALYKVVRQSNRKDK